MTARARFGNPAWFLMRKDTVSIQRPLLATWSMGITSGSQGSSVQSKICSSGAQLASHMPTASFLHHRRHPREGSANKMIGFFLLEKSKGENRNRKIVLSQKSMLPISWSTSQCCGLVLHPLMTTD